MKRLEYFMIAALILAAFFPILFPPLIVIALIVLLGSIPFAIRHRFWDKPKDHHQSLH